MLELLEKRPVSNLAEWIQKDQLGNAGRLDKRPALIYVSVRNGPCGGVTIFVFRINKQVDPVVRTNNVVRPNPDSKVVSVRKRVLFLERNAAVLHPNHKRLPEQFLPCIRRAYDKPWTEHFSLRDIVDAVAVKDIDA